MYYSVEPFSGTSRNIGLTPPSIIAPPPPSPYGIPPLITDFRTASPFGVFSQRGGTFRASQWCGYIPPPPAWSPVTLPFTGGPSPPTFPYYTPAVPTSSQLWSPATSEACAPTMTSNTVTSTTLTSTAAAPTLTLPQIGMPFPLPMGSLVSGPYPIGAGYTPLGGYPTLPPSPMGGMGGWGAPMIAAIPIAIPLPNPPVEESPKKVSPSSSPRGPTTVDTSTNTDVSVMLQKRIEALEAENERLRKLAGDTK
jgi:hypothetical protein